MKSWQQLAQDEKMNVILCNKLTASTNLEDMALAISIENWLESRGVYSLDYDTINKKLKDVEFWHEKAVKGIYP
jgi:hypothetical protein